MSSTNCLNKVIKREVQQFQSEVKWFVSLEFYKKWVVEVLWFSSKIHQPMKILCLFRENLMVIVQCRQCLNYLSIEKNNNIHTVQSESSTFAWLSFDQAVPKKKCPTTAPYQNEIWRYFASIQLLFISSMVQTQRLIWTTSILATLLPKLPDW